MFGRTKARVSLLFNRKAVISHKFEKRIPITVLDEFTGRPNHTITGLCRAWAEATPVSEGNYAITTKYLRTHSAGSVSNKSELSGASVSAEIDDVKKTLFTQEQALFILKSIEEKWTGEGYGVSQRQPFKKRIYSNTKTAT